MRAHGVNIRKGIAPQNLVNIPGIRRGLCGLLSLWEVVLVLFGFNKAEYDHLRTQI